MRKRLERAQIDAAALVRMMTCATHEFAVQTACGLLLSCPLQRPAYDARLMPPDVVHAAAERLAPHAFAALDSVAGKRVPPIYAVRLSFHLRWEVLGCACGRARWRRRLSLPRT